MRALMRQGESANTQASYGAALRYWGAWYHCRYGEALELPLPVPVVLQFIADHALRVVDGANAAMAQTAADDGQPEPDLAVADKIPVATDRRVVATRRGKRARGEPRSGQLVFELPPAIDRFLVDEGYKGKLGAFALNTLVHRVAVISKAHQRADLDNPCNHPGVRELLRHVRRSYAARGVVPLQQSALTKEPLELVLATCDDSPRGKRDRALLLFAWSSGGRRRSEVVDAIFENLRDHGARGFVYVLARSKSNQEAKQDDSVNKPVVGRAAEALKDWLAIGGITEGPIFRRILKGGKVTGEPLDAESVRKMVQKRCLQAGLSGKFSAHSLRSGFVTEAGRQQVSTAEAMKMTGHKNVETFMGYYRAGDVLESQAGRMMDE
ncbi:MAG: site-specific integrase [Variovorax sp.]